MSDTILGWVGIGMGLLMLAMGIQVRRGKLRRVLRSYQHWEYPFYIRNAPFGWISGGGSFTIIGGYSLVDTPARMSISEAVLVIFAVTALVGAFWIMWRVPLWTMPEWLQAQQPRPAKSKSKRKRARSS